ncbi:MAG: hypothetical protein IJR51_02870 [Clostridia bacterium]|nr:hypothetical protein [Clostridia bacterium]
MRKWLAIVLAALQFGFGCFLIANGGKADRAREKRIDEILANGAEFLFDLESFSYNADDLYEEPVRFELYSENWDNEHAFYPLTANENGVAVFGRSTEVSPEEPYFAVWGGDTYYRIDKKVLKTLFGADASDIGHHIYYRSWLQHDKNRFEVNGTWVSVYAVGTVYQGDVVYTGLVVGGERY